MKVNNYLGCGFQEVIYQRALEIEMARNNIDFKREQVMSIYYDNIEIGTRRVDFYVEDKVMVELKAVREVDDLHYAQTLNYLEIYKIQVGLLINFGAATLQVKRFNISHKLPHLS